jgi:hypothetical protein
MRMLVHVDPEAGRLESKKVRVRTVQTGKDERMRLLLKCEVM